MEAAMGTRSTTSRAPKALGLLVLLWRHPMSDLPHDHDHDPDGPDCPYYEAGVKMGEQLGAV